MGTEKEVKPERSSLLPTKILRKSPSSTPEDELRRENRGLYDSLMGGICGPPSRRQKVISRLPRQIPCT